MTTQRVEPYRVTTVRYVSGAVLATLRGLPTARHRARAGRHTTARRATVLELTAHYVCAFRYLRESALSTGARLATLAAPLAVAALVVAL